MSEYDSDTQVGRLLEQIKMLAKPRILGDFIQDTTGVFLPGFTALPAVTILSNASWKTKIKPAAERWRSGDMMALRSPAGADSKQEDVFFTPIGDMTIPLVDITPDREVSRFQKGIQLRPKDRWERVELQFAFLPWDAERESSKWRSHEIIAIARALEWSIRELQITAEVNGHEIPIEPEWGLRSWVARSLLDGIRFPLNYASRIVSPFLFRLRIDPLQKLSNGETVELVKDTVHVRFEYPERALAELYREAGLGQPGITGISVFGNALPIMNADLRSWLLNDSFGEFVRTAGAHPMGVAGIFPYRKAGKRIESELDTLDRYANVFSIQVDSGGQVLTHYGLPGEKDTTEEKQLLLWMTHGSLINGASYKYEGADIVQPMHKASLLLNQAFTVIPCFGGIECAESRDSEWYDKLFLNYSTTSQAFLHRDALIGVVRDLLVKLGYERVSIDDPVPEIRVIDRQRRRAVVIYLDNKSGKTIEPHHLQMMQDFVNDRAPVGTLVRIEPK